MLNEMKKKCTLCEVEKNINEFHHDSYSKSGYTSRCRKCRSVYSLNVYREKQSRGCYKRTKPNNLNEWIILTHNSKPKEYNMVLLELADGRICKGYREGDKWVSPLMPKNSTIVRYKYLE